MIAHCNNFPRRKTTTTGPTLWSRCGWWGTSCATPLTSCTASTSPTLTSSQRTSSSWTLTTIQFTTPKRWVSLYTKPIVWLLIVVKMKLLFKCSYVGWWCLLCKIISPIIFSAMLFFCGSAVLWMNLHNIFYICTFIKELFLCLPST